MELISMEFTGGIIHTNNNGEVIINNNATILVDKYGKIDAVMENPNTPENNKK